MILMSMSVAPFFKRDSLFKNIIGTFLTDESYALGMNKQIIRMENYHMSA